MRGTPLFRVAVLKPDQDMCVVVHAHLLISALYDSVRHPNAHAERLSSLNKGRRLLESGDEPGGADGVDAVIQQGAAAAIIGVPEFGVALRAAVRLVQEHCDQLANGAGSYQL